MRTPAEISPAYQLSLASPADAHQAERFGWKSKVMTERQLPGRFGSKPWVLLTGCFDGRKLSDGQLSLIQALASVAPLVVALESDQTLWWNKGMFRPYLHQEERAQRLAQRAEIAAVLPFSDTVFYGGRYPVHYSRERFRERFTILRPPIVPIWCGDPYNAYDCGMNADAKAVGASRLVYEYYPAPSTSRSLGY